MIQRAIALVAVCFVVGMIIGMLQTVLRRASEKTDYLPTATNDSAFAVIGLGSEEQRSIQAHTKQESYPAGTDEIELVITNHGEMPLSYTGYYDFRMLENGEFLPLSPRSDVLFDSTELVLGSGETVTQTVPINLFEEPLTAGTYKISQLVCFSGEDGGAAACTEITATFAIE